MAQTILVVEDDENLRLGLVDNLELAGFRAIAARTGEEALKIFAQEKPDLAILDIMLPDIDGYHLCKKMRSANSEMMLLMLTARTLEDDIIRGFEAGADDYLVKPYRIRELLMRVKALLRRQGGSLSLYHFADISIDFQARVVSFQDNTHADLTKKEFDMLCYLVDNRNRVLSRAQFLSAVWGMGVVVEERTVDNFVSTLKKKLRWKPDSPYRITSVRGIGYRMEIDEF